MTLAQHLQDKLVAKKIVIMDGGTGTEISRRGVAIHPELSWSANANITHPDMERIYTGIISLRGLKSSLLILFRPAGLHWRTMDYLN